MTRLRTLASLSNRSCRPLTPNETRRSAKMFGREKKDDLKFKTIPRRTARLDHTFIHRRIEFAATRTSDDLQFTETLRRGVSFVPFSSAPVSAPRCDAFSWPSDKSWRTASRTMSLRRAARRDLSKVDVSLRDTNRSRHGVSGLLSLAGRLRASSSYRLNFARSNRLGRNAAYLYET